MKPSRVQGQDPSLHDLRVIAPCLGARFSGINATIMAVVPEIAHRVGIVATGFHLPPEVPQLPLWTALRGLRHGPPRIWHARRNVDMIVGLFLKAVLRYPLILLWTSAAQRQHGWITRFCYHRMDALVATTGRAATALDRPAHVVRHGVDVRTFHPPANREEERSKKMLPGRRNLGLLGRVRPQKGTGDLVGALLRVLPRHPDWGAVIIGETTPEHRSYEKGLRSALRQAGLDDRVRFTGFVPDHGEIPAWYRSLDLVVCASRNEGFGLTCLEAMASGCAVVATRAGAWPELVREGEDGWLARAGDGADLARALELALSTEEATLAEMGRRARERAVRELAIAGECEGLVAVYDSLFRSHGEPGIPAVAREASS